MKTLTFTMILILACVSTFPQAGKYQWFMQKGVYLIQNSKTFADYMEAGKHFEQIAATEPEEWLPVYYASYSNLSAGLLADKKEDKDLCWDKALKEITAANAILRNNSEIYALEAYIDYMKASLDPESRKSFSQAAMASVDKAIRLDPENPRSYFVHGLGLFYTPEPNGGGKSAAKPWLEKAVAKFTVFKAESDIAPSWGAPEAQMLLAQCTLAL